MNEYNLYDIKDTIVALSSPYSKSALAIIRMSGNKALEIASKICYYAGNESKNINNFEHRKSYYALVKDENNTPIDELIVLSTLSPNTFTSEDTIEFISHGSIVVIDSLINLIIRQGARAANRGEFTYRAYINGRIGISEAEAIHDLIDSNNKLMAEASIYKMRGRLTREIDKLRENIKNSLMLVCGELDFPEDDTENFSYDKLIENFYELKKDIENILSNSKRVETLINGIKVAILGRVNAGKSSIFNMILDRERAIVSNIAGTTRDFLSENIYIDNIPFYLMDTAGFHKEADNDIELEGIERAKKCADEANIIIAVFDISDKANEDDINLIEFLKTLNNKNIIYILNKTDSENKFDYNINSENIIKISTKTKEGKEKLIQSLKNYVSDSDMEIFNKESYVNSREKGYLEKSLKQLDICIEKSKQSFSLDEVAEEMNILNNILGNISGKIDAEEVINEIFANFCIGK
ncbi:tRNA uridine-5-carboxymethylaminomethyl(34) synthesis GTPase MnmE [Brachyspira alvinipulli]|uniref:tRNA uridine-5-carboxymethylaminomethyl(34) synthesis GTPase MnmE n=1 Tax=Brachyspira alvinipulli TaxID=84379 RepID=UPI0004830D20|nr:tRNA uridine-5-carboxymethylaminomethyl(34) synthesis GTPase MnmE [Brachyspira alvinipulli]